MATIKEIQGWFDEWEPKLAKIAPAGLNVARALRNAMVLIQDPKSPTLRDCEKTSLSECLMRCIQVGLYPDGNQAHLIPRTNRRVTPAVLNCTLLIDWKGMAVLAMRSGLLSRSPIARLVHERDTFRIVLGTEDRIEHEVYTGPEDPGGITHAYIVFHFKGGGSTFEHMTIEEIEHARDSGYRTRDKDSIWAKHYGEQCRKTVARRGYKHLQLEGALNDALSYSYSAEQGLPPGEVVPPRVAKTDEEMEADLTAVAPEKENADDEEKDEGEGETDGHERRSA